VNETKLNKSPWSVACVAGGFGYTRELRSRTRVQKAAQAARRMGRSLVEIPSRAGEVRERISGFAAKSFTRAPTPVSYTGYLECSCSKFGKRVIPELHYYAQWKSPFYLINPPLINYIFNYLHDSCLNFFSAFLLILCMRCRSFGMEYWDS